MYLIKPNLRFLTPTIIIFALFISACSSRYRLDLYLTAQEERGRAKIETTELVKAAALGEIDTEISLIPGNGDVAIVTTGRRGKLLKKGSQYALAFDEHLRVKLYLELPLDLHKAQYPMIDNSCAQLLGNFEMPPEQKIFGPVDGQFSIDSLKGSMLYLTVDGRFENKEKQVIELDGQFKMRIRD